MIITVQYYYGTAVLLTFLLYFYFSVHTKDDVSFIDGSPTNNLTKSNTFEGKIKAFAFSEDGKKFGWITNGQ